MALVVVNDVNLGGLLLEDRLWAMPAHVRTVALCGVRHGASTTLATSQLYFGHDLYLLEPSFLVGANEEEQEELIDDFTAIVKAIMVPMYAGDIILAAFFDP